VLCEIFTFNVNVLNEICLMFIGSCLVIWWSEDWSHMLLLLLLLLLLLSTGSDNDTHIS